MMTMMTAAVPVAVRPSPSINVSERPDSNQRQSKRRGQEPFPFSQPFLSLLQDSLYGFPRVFTVTSEHIRLFTF